MPKCPGTGSLLRAPLPGLFIIQTMPWSPRAGRRSHDVEDAFVATAGKQLFVQDCLEHVAVMPLEHPPGQSCKKDLGRAHLDRRGLGFVPWGDTLRQMHEQTQASCGSDVGYNYMALPLHRTAKPHQGPPMCTCSTTTPLEQVTGRKGRQIGANMQCRMIVYASVHVYCWWHVALGDFALRRDGTHIRGASQ